MEIVVIGVLAGIGLILFGRYSVPLLSIGWANVRFAGTYAAILAFYVGGPIGLIIGGGTIASAAPVIAIGMIILGTIWTWYGLVDSNGRKYIARLIRSADYDRKRTIEEDVKYLSGKKDE